MEEGLQSTDDTPSAAAIRPLLPALLLLNIVGRDVNINILRICVAVVVVQVAILYIYMLCQSYSQRFLPSTRTVGQVSSLLCSRRHGLHG
jgi:hypothetical protein